MRKFFLIFVIAFLGISVFSKDSQTGRNMKYSKEKYTKDWEKISQAESKGLPKSAIELVDKIYTKAKSDNNPASMIKALVHKFKYNSYHLEEDYIEAIKILESEIKNTEVPVKNVLHSLAGEMYWTYYQNNRFTFLNRTNVTNMDLSDMKTWDLTKIIETSLHHYDRSLDNESELQTIQIDLLNEVLYKGNKSDEVRSTIYDFLAHRALDFLSNSESSLSRPAEQFLLDDSKFFGKPEIFTSIQVQTKDTNSFKYRAFLILQKLLAFHTNQKDSISENLKELDKFNPYIDVELRRLNFVHNNSVHPEKEKLYFHALKNLEERSIKYHASTLVSYQIAQIFEKRGASYIPHTDDRNRLGYSRAMEKCQEAIKRFPKSDGATNCKSLQARLNEKSLNIQLEKHNLPNQSFIANVNYRNFSKLYTNVYRWTTKDHSKLKSLYNKHVKNGEYPEVGQLLIEYLKEVEPVETVEYNLPKADDYQSHSVELKMPSLNYGNYLIIASDSPKLKSQKIAFAYGQTYITRFGYIHRDMDKNREFHILDRESGEPLSEIRATVVYEEYDYNKSKYAEVDSEVLVTDKNGHFQVPLYGAKNYRYYYVRLERGEDKFEINNDNYELNHYDNSRAIFGQYSGKYSKPSEVEQKFVHFFTDRAIYRPGQTIYFKGILLKKKKDKVEILKNQSVSVVFYNVNYQKVSELKLKSNEFGTVSGTFFAPTSGLLGNMQIQASIGGSKSFSVEEYKRPKFEVTMDNIKGAYKLGDKVKVTGLAKAFSGANIDGAKLQYRVVRKAIFPYWWWCYYGYYPQSPQVEITNGVAKTDENGKFEVEFTVIPDLSVPKESSPIFHYTVYADVTDINGETRSSMKTVSAGYQSLVLSTNVGEKINSNEPLKFNLNSINMGGEFETANVTVKIHKLKQPSQLYKKRNWSRPDKFIYTQQEWQNTFPNDQYDEEANHFKWDTDETMYNQTISTTEKTKVEISSLKNWKTGFYKVELEAKDKFNQDVKEVKFFALYSPMDNQIPTAMYNWFHIEKQQLEPGEFAKIYAISSGHVLYEIERKGKIIHKEWIALDQKKPVQKEISLKILENYRGNISVHYTFIKDNRAYQNSDTIIVPHTNKELDIEFETFRNKLLPGEKEEWRLKIKGKMGEKVSAEMVATLYDASLDTFRANQFHFNIYNSYYASRVWTTSHSFSTKSLNFFEKNWNEYLDTTGYSYDSLNWFGYYYRNKNRYKKYYKKNGKGSAPMYEEDEEDSDISDDVVTKSTVSSPKKKAKIAMDKKDANKPSKPLDQEKEKSISNEGSPGKKMDSSDVQVRTNFNETAFFYPHLTTNENGEVLINFTIPESLTKWKMLGFAHTEDLKFGTITNQLTTSKNLMVVPNEPRFFREGDQITFSTKINNISENDLSGKIKIEFLDAVSQKQVQILESNQADTKDFSVNKNQSTVVDWNLKVKEGLGALTYRVIAKADPILGKSHSDGEEKTLPVLTDKMLVTETMPLNVKGNQARTFSLDKLVNNNSSTLRHHKLTLEYTPNPVWYAVQALPYIMEYPYECAEQTFNRLYSNSISSHIVDSVPNIKKTFENWNAAKNGDKSALLSNLEKNQDLKTALLEDTPWVLDANDETERKRRIAVLFDVNRMSHELQSALKKLTDLQSPNGSYPWFKGMPEDRYITQYIVTGFARLNKIGVASIAKDANLLSMNQKSIKYLDTQIAEDYRQLKYLAKEGKIKLEDNHLSYSQINYLYARSYYTDLEVSKSHKEAFNYYLNQSKKYWTQYNNYMKGMIAISLHRFQERKIPKEIIASLKETATISEELGMYWKEAYGYYWYELPIEKQALMIEVFHEVAKDENSVNELKVWLLKQKQTTDWKTTKATSDAIYALLLGGGEDWISKSAEFNIQVGKESINTTNPKLQKESGTGYFKVAYNEDKISNEMGKVVVTPISGKNTVSWGGLYWQYFEKLDKISSAETPLKLKRQLYVQKNTSSGPVLTPITENSPIQVGDLVKVRIELRVDRNMEYVHMKDMRASGFEPTNVISRYKWQDGLGYYESTKDSSTNFFFSYLPKGVYIFEYSLRASHKGEFSNGITTIQCMYAPEFSSHSEGLRIKIK